MRQITKKHLSFALGMLFLGLTTGHAQGLSAGGDNPLFRHLPPDAHDVYHINLPALTSKVSWEEMTGRIPFPIKGENSAALVAMIKDPSLAGIDIHKDIFVTSTNNDNPDSTGYTTILVHLSDSGKFITFLRSREHGLRDISIPGKGRAAGKNLEATAWDKELAVVTIIKQSSREIIARVKPSGSNPPAKGKPGTGPAKAPDLVRAVSPAVTLAAAKRSLAALHGFDGSVFTTDVLFKTGFSDDADIHIWAIQGKSLSMLMKTLLHKDPKNAFPFTQPADKSKPVTRNLSAIRFEAGRITMKSRSFLSPEDAALYAKFNNHPLNTDLLARLPQNPLLGMLNLHFDPSAIGDLLDKLKLRGKLDSSLAGKDLSTNDLMHALKGDFLLAATRPEAGADSGEKPKNPTIYFITTIGDNASFKKVADKLHFLKESDAQGNGTAGDGTPGQGGMLGKMKTAYTLKDNILVISSAKPTTDGYFSNTEKRSTDFVNERMKNNPFTLYIDVKAVAGFLQAVMPEASGKNKQMLQFMQPLDKVIFTFGSMQNNEAESFFELKMTDASENSLKSLFNLMGSGGK